MLSHGKFKVQQFFDNKYQEILVRLFKRYWG
jgi:hypothetical protein